MAGPSRCAAAYVAAAAVVLAAAAASQLMARPGHPGEGPPPAAADRDHGYTGGHSTGSPGRFDLAELLGRAADVAAAPLAHEGRAHGSPAGALAGVPVLAPAAGTLSSSFSAGRWHPVLKLVRPHRGIDIAAPAGTPILAPAPGTVRFAGAGSRSFGLVVELDHGGGFVTRFAHASRVLVRPGDQVHRGQLIALVGSTGLATGPHLHYEVLLHGRQLDPALFLPPGTFAPHGSGQHRTAIAPRAAEDD
jgi:murein DD-endopeptidase MepM/ murein hydrolase activator NlpD